MKRLAIVGSVTPADTEKARRIIRDVLSKLCPDVVVSGGAQGIDSMAAEEAEAMGIAVVECLPLAQAWPQFKARNNDIANYCDMLVRIKAPSSKTYGSGYTRDVAVRAGKPSNEYEA